MFEFPAQTRGAALALLVFGTMAANAAEPQVVPLWPNGAPGFESRRNEPERVLEGGRLANINNPSITVFVPPADKANGAAVLIFPGGGHSHLAFAAEGIEPARYWTNLGVTAFILKYRLARETNSPYSLQIHPLQDSQRAMRLIRSRAGEWHIDPNRLGVMGFSAGGEVASLVTYAPSAGNPNAPDPIDRLDAAPDFQIVIYPGPLGIPAAIPKTAPPAFFLVADDDRSHEKAVLELATKYNAARRPMEVHIFERGGHGFGLGSHSRSVSIRQWTRLLTAWMNERGILSP